MAVKNQNIHLGFYDHINKKKLAKENAITPSLLNAPVLIALMQVQKTGTPYTAILGVGDKQQWVGQRYCCY